MFCGECGEEMKYGETMTIRTTDNVLCKNCEKIHHRKIKEGDLSW